MSIAAMVDQQHVSSLVASKQSLYFLQLIRAMLGTSRVNQYHLAVFPSSTG